MAGPSVHQDASRKNRSLADSAAAAAPKERLSANPVLLFWRKLIDSAVADAKRTYDGLPTYSALNARWWIEEHKPKESDRDEWERSFACACGWLELDAAEERKRLLADIDACLQVTYTEYVRAVVYVRRAAMLTCAGVPTAIARQFVLPLVSEHDYEDVAGIEHGDPRGAFSGFIGLQAA